MLRKVRLLLIFLFCFLLLLLLTREAARQGRAFSFPVTIDRTIFLYGKMTLEKYSLFRPHLMEETPSALFGRKAFYLNWNPHLQPVRCGYHVICFSEADYNIKIIKSQEPSAIILMILKRNTNSFYFLYIYLRLRSCLKYIYRQQSEAVYIREVLVLW